MKKTLSFLIVFVALLTFSAFSVYADESAPIVFNMIEDDGTLPNGKGRNGDCYFPQGTSSINAEVYTWGNGTMAAESGYAVFTPKEGNGMLEFDTFPSDRKWSADKRLTYLVMNLKTEKAAEVSVAVVAQGAKYKKNFNIDFKGTWQQIIIDLNDTTGWYVKDENNNYNAIGASPMNIDGKQLMAGGFRLDLPGSTTVGKYTIDYIGIFASPEQAKAYKAKAETGISKVYTGTVESSSDSQASSSSSSSASSSNGSTEKNTTDNKKPSIKNALTKDAENADDATHVSAVNESLADDGKIIYKFANIGEFKSDGNKWELTENQTVSYLQTWSVGTLFNTDSGLLKFTSNSNGATLFEVHTKKSPGVSTMPYLVIGYKSSDDFSSKGSVGYLYSSGNTHRFELNFKNDGKWQYNLYNLNEIKLQARSESGNYENVTDRGAVGGIGFGAYRIDFPVVQGIWYYIDYIGFFATSEEAEKYISLSKEAISETENATADESKFTYMKGYEDGTFRPSAQMTRAEACAVIARLLADEETIATARNTSFTDIKNTEWYYGYITYLEELGYLPNYSGEFKPNQNITRGEFIKLCFEAGGLDFSMKRPKYADLNKDHKYYKEIVFASGNGVVTGYNNGDGTMSFKPDGEITRAEIATIVNRILKIEPASESAQEFSDLDSSHWAFGTIMAIAAAN